MPCRAYKTPCVLLLPLSVQASGLPHSLPCVQLQWLEDELAISQQDLITAKHELCKLSRDLDDCRHARLQLEQQLLTAQSKSFDLEQQLALANAQLHTLEPRPRPSMGPSEHAQAYDRKVDLNYKLDLPEHF